MRVKCIIENWDPAPGCENAPLPVFNNDYDVAERGVYNGVDSYVLPELSDVYVYAIKNFAPIDSDLDETTLVTEEFEEKYCVPVNQ